jgi:alpha-N-arabinofuranosidase
MTPEYYSNEFRRYNTFVKNYGENKVFRIACGSNGEDFNWTEVLMKNVGRRMNGLSLHYYTLPTGKWDHKGSATEFDETQYHATLVRALHMEDLVKKHASIMDQHDPEKKSRHGDRRVGHLVRRRARHQPGFLYQQNTMRDALVAGLNFHIFHKYADRIAMANIAQAVNVLQAMILTDKDRMIPSRRLTNGLRDVSRCTTTRSTSPIEIESPGV